MDGERRDGQIYTDRWKIERESRDIGSIDTQIDR